MGLAHLIDSQRHAVQILVNEFVVVLGDVFQNFIAVIVVELLVDSRGTLQRCRHIRPRIYERFIPELGDFKNFEFRPPASLPAKRLHFPREN